MKQVIAMHGWSGDSNAWQPWQRHFHPLGWQWQSGERGYGSLNPNTPGWLADRDPSPGQRVVIGHSLGPHLLPPEVLAGASAVVLLASFGRFVPEGADGRALRAGLTGMQKALGSATETAMLEAFLTRAAHPASAEALPPGPLHQGLSAAGRRRLRDDLDLLMHTAGLPAGFPPKARVLVVEAANDAIVVPAASRDLLQTLQHHLGEPPEHWTLQGVGHALLVPDLLLRVQQWLDPAAPGR